MALAQYLSDTELLLHDSSLQFYSSGQLTTYINQARLRIAAKGQCCRVLVSKTAPITSINVTAGGTGYLTPPTITLAGGSGASLTAVLTGTAVTSVTVNAGGTGYLPSTNLVFTSTSGSGAQALTVCSGAGTTTTNQEVYTFSALNSLVATTSGISQIQGILSIAVSQGTISPYLGQLSWAALQAYMRSYNTLYTNYPLYWAQYTYGVNGSFYLWPIPSGSYGMDVDTYCLPNQLSTDADPEAIPYPWTEAVKYYACYLALMNAQRPDQAKIMMDEYNRCMLEARAYTQGPFIPDMYDGDYA